MITEAKIRNDIARIEAIMYMGSKREKTLLAALRQYCFNALVLVGQMDDETYEKQHKLATNRLNNYDLAMQDIRSRWLKRQITDLQEKELKAEVLKYYKPDRLRHQIRFLNYIHGHADIIPEELLTSLKQVSQTEQYHAKQKGSR